MFPRPDWSLSARGRGLEESGEQGRGGEKPRGCTGQRYTLRPLRASQGSSTECSRAWLSRARASVYVSWGPRPSPVTHSLAQVDGAVLTCEAPGPGGRLREAINRKLGSESGRVLASCGRF